MNTIHANNKLSFKQQYREAIGLFATGVGVLLIENKGVVHGMTANAISSLSLEPVQLLVCPSKSAAFSELIEADACFSVNILGIHQEDISNYFAGDKQRLKHAEPLYDYLFSKRFPCPRLKDSIAAFACQISQIHDGGDHWIVVGKVNEIYQNTNNPKPLLFFGGKYHYPCVQDQVIVQPAADPYR